MYGALHCEAYTSSGDQLCTPSNRVCTTCAQLLLCPCVCVWGFGGQTHFKMSGSPHTHTHNHTVKRTTWTHRSTINYYDCNSARDAWLRAQRLCEYRVPIKRVHNNSTKVSAPAQPYRAARWHSARAKCCSAAADTARWVLLDSVRCPTHNTALGQLLYLLEQQGVWEWASSSNSTQHMCTSNISALLT